MLTIDCNLVQIGYITTEALIRFYSFAFYFISQVEPSDKRFCSPVIKSAISTKPLFLSIFDDLTNLISGFYKLLNQLSNFCIIYFV